MARTKKKDEWSFLGAGYREDARREASLLHESIQILNVAEIQIPMAQQKLAAKPHWPRDAKDQAIVIFNNLRKMSAAARLSLDTSHIPALPKYGEFLPAHRLHANLEQITMRVEAVRRALLHATHGSDIEAIEQALSRANTILHEPFPT